MQARDSEVTLTRGYDACLRSCAQCLFNSLAPTSTHNVPVSPQPQPSQPRPNLTPQHATSPQPQPSTLTASLQPLPPIHQPGQSRGGRHGAADHETSPIFQLRGHAPSLTMTVPLGAQHDTTVACPHTITTRAGGLQRLLLST